MLATLPEAARRYLEKLMTTDTYEYKSDFARRYFSEGKAEALLTLLAARGVQVSNDARTRITECTDIDQLDTWVRRAVTASSVTDLFDA